MSVCKNQSAAIGNGDLYGPWLQADLRTHKLVSAGISKYTEGSPLAISLTSHPSSPRRQSCSLCEPSTSRRSSASERGVIDVVPTGDMPNPVSDRITASSGQLILAAMKKVAQGNDDLPLSCQHDEMSCPNSKAGNVVFRQDDATLEVSSFVVSSLDREAHICTFGNSSSTFDRGVHQILA